MDNPEAMGKTVVALQAAGFTVMMDDFGSGYSSLNTLKDIPIDILKIDMKFLSGRAAAGRKECIMASVVHMAGWLKIPVIMEGVETEEQIDFLKSIGCGYVQGYYFARPMPVREYEALVRGIRQVPVPTLSVNHEALVQTIWAHPPQIDLLFNSIRQPAAIYEFENSVFRAIRVNAAFNAAFGYGGDAGEDLDARYRRRLSATSLSAVTDAFRRTAAAQAEAACEYELNDESGTVRRLRLDLRYWGANEGCAVIFALFTPLSGTEQ